MRHIPRVFEGTRLYGLGPWHELVALVPLEFPGIAAPDQVIETAQLRVTTWRAEIGGEWWEWEATGPRQRQWHNGVEYMACGAPRRMNPTPTPTAFAIVERAREVAAHA